MLRWVEKKNWRKNVESCWTVSENINKCLDSSKTFESLSKDLKSLVRKSVNKNYIVTYVNAWSSNTNVAGEEGKFYDSNSDLWENKTLEELKSECDIFALHECCKEKFNLNNLEGDYENFAQTLKK
jgi:hypothetical protein